MDYNLDQLSSMTLGDLELFPECVLANGLQKVHSTEDIFKGNDPEANSFITSSTLSLNDDSFPDWLDLKMDMSLLEGLETSDVLDDLLTGEVSNGQSLDSLPALQMEAKTLPSLDLEQLPYEQLPITIPSPRVVSPTVDVSTTQATPPSSPDWLVPDIFPYSPASFLSPVSEPSSPEYHVKPISPSPVAAEDAALALMASGVSFSLVVAEDSVSGPSLILDLHSTLSFDTEDRYTEVIQQSPEQSDILSPDPAPVVLAKTKKKVKAVRNVTNRSNKLKNLGPSESSSDDNIFPAQTSKRERKRKQNKDAAMRYRIKKRIEVDVLAEEEYALLDENKKLRDQVQQLSNELGYLKNLMREMFKAKGLLK